jgi:hypothetical protein
MRSPYEGLAATQFWRTGVAEAHSPPKGLYRKKFSIDAGDRIVTAGSCFAQHISLHLRANGFTVLDYEPAPSGLSAETAGKFGYGLYSARYGNIYAVRQLLQLAHDAFQGHVDPADIWTKEGRYYDALRPAVEPDGFESIDEAIELRREHLTIVRKLFTDMTVFIFTLGLTEAWVHRQSGRVFATAPGTLAGDYDPAIHAFENFTSAQIYSDFALFYDLIKSRNPNVNMLLTVSPVPLTATATRQHALTATTYSKSALRAAAGELCDTYAGIDYFPSYEIVASPWARRSYYESNMRSVSAEGVNAVMQAFFDEHGAATGQPEDGRASDEKAERKARRQARRASRSSDGTDSEKDTDTTSGDRKSERRARRRAGRGATKPAEAPADAEDVVCEEILLDAFSR